MLRNKKLGWGLVVISVLANNYVYLHDIVTVGHNSAIYLGWKAGLGIVLSLGIITVGLAIAWFAESKVV